MYEICIEGSHDCIYVWQYNSDWQNGKALSGQGILNRLEKSGKSHKILEKSGNFRQMLFQSKKQNIKKILEKLGNFVSPE